MHNDFPVIISGSFSEYDFISQIALSFTIINLNSRINNKYQNKKMFEFL